MYLWTLWSYKIHLVAKSIGTFFSRRSTLLLTKTHKNLCMYNVHTSCMIRKYNTYSVRYVFITCAMWRFFIMMLLYCSCTFFSLKGDVMQFEWRHSNSFYCYIGIVCWTADFVFLVFCVCSCIYSILNIFSLRIMTSLMKGENFENWKSLLKHIY